MGKVKQWWMDEIDRVTEEFMSNPNIKDIEFRLAMRNLNVPDDAIDQAIDERDAKKDKKDGK